MTQPATSASPKLIPFTAAREGYASRAYRDPGGVVTIGNGSTDFDKTFHDYWLKTRGHVLQMGDTITRDEAGQLLLLSLQHEYSPAVAKALPNANQQEHDGATDVSYNCGAGTLKDRWARALAGGDVAGAVELLKSTRVTAAGKFLQGLVNRRVAEGRLIKSGDYGDGVVPELAGPNGAVVVNHAAPTDVASVKAYQKDLTKLGYYTGTIDGLVASSDAAVRKFQSANGLTVDGDVGPATRSTIRRQLDRMVASSAGSAGGAIAGGGGIVTDAAGKSADQLDPSVLFNGGKWFVIAIIAAVVITIVWSNRGRILGRRTPA